MRRPYRLVSYLAEAVLLGQLSAAALAAADGCTAPRPAARR